MIKGQKAEMQTPFVAKQNEKTNSVVAKQRKPTAGGRSPAERTEYERRSI